MQARCTRYWPGAEPEFPGEQTHGKPCEWTHEREWRVIGSGDPPAFGFRSEDVAFLLVPEGDTGFGEYPCVRLDRLTGSIDDPVGVWLGQEFYSTLRAS